MCFENSFAFRVVKLDAVRILHAGLEAALHEENPRCQQTSIRDREAQRQQRFIEPLVSSIFENEARQQEGEPKCKKQSEEDQGKVVNYRVVGTVKIKVEIGCVCGCRNGD